MDRQGNNAMECQDQTERFRAGAIPGPSDMDPSRQDIIEFDKLEQKAFEHLEKLRQLEANYPPRRDEQLRGLAAEYQGNIAGATRKESDTPIKTVTFEEAGWSGKTCSAK